MTVGDKVLHFYYDANGYPLSVVYNDTTYYYATNLQGDVVAIINTSGKQMVGYTYDAWGRLLSTTGSLASTLGTYNPLRYRGYVYDSETQLYYLQSRYYNPTIGRFINADSLVSTGGLLGNNLFAYCNNNPVMHSDPSGESAILITLGIMLVGGLIGSAVSATSSMLTQQALTGTINWKSVGVAAASGFVSGAIAASPIGLPGQIIAGGIIGGVSYAVDSYVNDVAITLDGMILSVGMGAVSGLIGGSGANKNNTLTTTITTLKKTIAREARRANQTYAQKAVSSAVSYAGNILSTTAWSSSVKFAAGCGIANGATVAYSENRLLVDWPSFVPWG